MRIEVTFINGKLVAYPDVNEDTICTDYKDGTMEFDFAHGRSKSMIMLRNVLFFEYIEK